MTLTGTGRVVWLALLCWIGTLGPALAHSLPGSVLLFSRQGDDLRVTLQIALEDLVLAFPDVRALEDLPIDRDLPAEQLSRLDAYLAEHVALDQGTAPLPLSLTRASLATAANDHAGTFTLVVAELTAALARTTEVFPLTLSYDAVMHEVRSHDATVYWARPGTAPLGIAEFRYETVGDRPRPILLEVPPGLHDRLRVGTPAVTGGGEVETGG